MVALLAVNTVLVTAISFSPVEVTPIPPVAAVMVESLTLIPLPLTVALVPSRVLPVIVAALFELARVSAPSVAMLLLATETFLLPRCKALFTSIAAD